MKPAAPLVLSLVLALSGCKSSRAPDLTTQIEAEAMAYHRAQTPSLRLESSRRRLELLNKLEVSNDKRYEKFIALQRLVTFLRIYRWNYELGNFAEARSALVEAEKINKQYGQSAISGADLLDERNHEEILKRVDELDAGYAGPEH